MEGWAILLLLLLACLLLVLLRSALPLPLLPLHLPAQYALIERALSSTCRYSSTITSSALLTAGLHCQPCGGLHVCLSRYGTSARCSEGMPLTCSMPAKALRAHAIVSVPLPM